MSIWTMGDLHLSFGTDKPMDSFPGWKDYVSRIEENWKSVVNIDDTVVIPGDFSWGIDFSEALPDFEFVEKLPGKKLIIKGNHDFWWGTKHKIEAFFSENGLNSFEIIHNNSVLCENAAICGTRGWVFMPNEEHDSKISAREAMRLEASLADSERFPEAEKIVFLHYPPVYANEIVPNIIDVLKKYNVKKVFYGHLHGASKSMATQGNYMGIDFKLVSADNLDFCLYKVK